MKKIYMLLALAAIIDPEGFKNACASVSEELGENMEEDSEKESTE